MPERPAEQVLAERLGAQRNGVASDGRGWFRSDAERDELRGIARDLLAELDAAGFSVIATREDGERH